MSPVELVITAWFGVPVLVKRILYSSGWLDEFAYAFSRRLAPEREMRSIPVAFCFPLIQLSSQVLFCTGNISPIELFRICFVAPLDLVLGSGSKNLVVALEGGGKLTAATEGGTGHGVT